MDKSSRCHRIEGDFLQLMYRISLSRIKSCLLRSSPDQLHRMTRDFGSSLSEQVQPTKGTPTISNQSIMIFKFKNSVIVDFVHSVYHYFSSFWRES